MFGELNPPKLPVATGLVMVGVLLKCFAHISVYKQNGGSVFAFILSGGGSHPCTPVSYTTVVDLCHILSLYKNEITGIQSYKIVFAARACMGVRRGGETGIFPRWKLGLRSKNFWIT